MNEKLHSEFDLQQGEAWNPQEQAILPDSVVVGMQNQTKVERPIPEKPLFTPDATVLPDSVLQALEPGKGSREPVSEIQALTLRENATPTPEVANQSVAEQKGFFRKRWDTLTGLWHRTKEAKTTELLIKKPARLIGAVAVYGAMTVVDAVVLSNQAVNRGVDAGIHEIAASARRTEADKKAGYDENNLMGRLLAKAKRHPHNPRPPQPPMPERERRELEQKARRDARFESWKLPPDQRTDSR